MLAALAVAALAAPAPSDLREAAINPKAREPIFAPAPAPCDAGFVPTCEQAKGFGLCNTTNSACDMTCVDEVKMTCPVTCSLSAEATSGHLEPDATPSDYSKHLPPAATAAICSTCADHPDLPCCHDHPHEGDDRRRLQSITCTNVIFRRPLPFYLSVDGFKDCLGTMTAGTSTMWCMPADMPNGCKSESWESLSSSANTAMMPCP